LNEKGEKCEPEGRRGEREFERWSNGEKLRWRRKP